MENLGSEYIKEPQLNKKLLTDFAQKICNGSRHHPPHAQKLKEGVQHYQSSKNKNENHNEIPMYSHQNELNKPENTKGLGDVQKLKLSYTGDGNFK